MQDRDGAQAVVGTLAKRFTKLRKILADSIYNVWIAQWVKALRQLYRTDLETVKRSEGATGFHGAVGRWGVERTFALLSFHR